MIMSEMINCLDCNYSTYRSVTVNLFRVWKRAILYPHDYLITRYPLHIHHEQLRRTLGILNHRSNPCELIPEVTKAFKILMIQNIDDDDCQYHEFIAASVTNTQS